MRDFGKPSPSEKFALSTIVVLALAVRLVWVALVSVEPISDSYAYFSFATNIAAGNGYCWTPGNPTTYWAVGPSAFFAFFLLFLPSGAAVVVGNLIATVAGVVAAFFAGRRFFGPLPGLTGAVLFALWPTSIMFTTVYNSEMLFAPLMLAALWMVGSAKLGPRSWAAMGVLFALTAFMRPVALLFPFVLGVSRLARSRRPAETAVGVTIAVAVMAICIAPWTVRNHRVTGGFVVISTNGGTNLWMGNNPDSDGTYQRLPDRVDGMSELERNRQLKHEAKQYIIRDPIAFVGRTMTKLIKLHRSETIGVAWNEPGMKSGPLHSSGTALKLIGTLFWWGILAGALGGGILLIRFKGIWVFLFHPIVLSALYLIAVQSMVVSQDRYHMQWSPHFILLTGFLVSSLIVARRSHADTDADVPTPSFFPPDPPEMLGS